MAEQFSFTFIAQGLCACGCGQTVKPGRRFVHTHNLSSALKTRWSKPEAKIRFSQKMKELLTIRGCTKETRAKLSAAAKARLADPEYKKKWCEKLKAKWQDPEYRKHQSEIHKKLIGEKSPRFGTKHSEETLKKLRESHLGKPSAMKGKTHTPEVRKRLSASHAGVPLSEKHRKSIGLASKEVWARTSPEKKESWLKKIGEGNKGKVISAETRKKCSEANKKLWQNPEHARKCLVFNSPNKSELKLLDILNSIYPGEWKFVGDGQVLIDGKCPDFININGQKKIIELYGKRWHQDDDPKEREKVFEPFGYKTLVIWDYQLAKTKEVKAAICEFMEV